MLFLVWGFLVSGIASPFESLVGATAFAWLPDWFSVTDVTQLAQFPQRVLMATFVFGLVVIGLVAPIIEELYFGGHLLPRISRLGGWAPLVNVLLFSLYHFWTPWQFLSRVLLMLPLAFVARRKRNVILPIISHSAVNVMGWILTFALVLRQL